ncbi:hypothetical protein AKJ38_02640, partial [candidate division MSBL1 archaeon SCGC-AAA259I14]
MKKVKKTVQGGIVNLTNVKESLLDCEFENLQKFLRGDEDVELYSANKQQAERNYEKIKDGKEYPVSIRKDLIDIRECDSDVGDYFVKIPVAGRYGGVKVPINTHMGIGEGWEICESKLFRKNGKFYLNVTVEIEVEEVEEYEGVLGTDLGLRNPVVSVALPSRKSEFRGREIKQ